MPSQPHTAAYKSVQISGLAWQLPAMSPAPQWAVSGNAQYNFSWQRKPAMPPHISPSARGVRGDGGTTGGGAETLTEGSCAETLTDGVLGVLGAGAAGAALCDEQPNAVAATDTTVPRTNQKNPMPRA